MLAIAEVFELTRSVRHPVYLSAVAHEGVATFSIDVPTRQTAGVRGDILHSADQSGIESVDQGADESGDEAGHSDESENESKTGDAWMRLWCWLRPTLRQKLQVIFLRCIWN